MNFLHQGFQKLSSDRQTDTTKIIYSATSRMLKDNLFGIGIYTASQKKRAVEHFTITSSTVNRF